MRWVLLLTLLAAMGLILYGWMEGQREDGHVAIVWIIGGVALLMLTAVLAVSQLFIGGGA